MLTYDLTARGNTPIYEYLYRCLRSDILSGALEVDGRLPSRRSFAELFGDFFATVQGRAPTQAELDALNALREEVDPCGR